MKAIGHSGDGASPAPVNPTPLTVIKNARKCFLEEGVPLLESLLKRDSTATTPFILVVENTRAGALAIVGAAILQQICVLVPSSKEEAMVPYVAEHTGISLVVNPQTHHVSKHVLASPPPTPAWLQHDQVQNGGGVCMLTSGSTGRPKVVFCTWSSMFLQGQATEKALFPHGPCRFVCASSIAHAYAINALFAIYMSPYGDLCELQLGIDIHAIQSPMSQPSSLSPPSSASIHSTTILYGTPGIYTKILQSATSNLSLAHVVSFSAGTTLPAHLKQNLRDSFGLTVLQNYGSTETGGIATELPSVESPSELKSSLQPVGHPWPDTEVRIVRPTSKGRVTSVDEDGEIHVRTPWQCAGYVEHGALTPISRTGFYHTGDGGAVDLTSGIILVGQRLREPIHFRHQGLDVFIPPQQVERTFRTNPHVTDVLLPLLVRSRMSAGFVKPVALVVAPSSTHDELVRWCAAHLPSVVQDLDIRLVEFLPCSPAGKLMYSLSVD
ncbi:hypothetical protein DYB32_000568 [Aphanomyces invadans]|uniref:AMP-dependent synthetase/ligase domain-containing protein n=1 Tax=Aphanomyces invadans TaxID=157072 RepID=A0A418B9Q1_9STRA|nr:hypothetical protein DYB32_000568 [Aphanomyces invadans]